MKGPLNYMREGMDLAKPLLHAVVCTTALHLATAVPTVIHEGEPKMDPVLLVGTVLLMCPVPFETIKQMCCGWIIWADMDSGTST